MQIKGLKNKVILCKSELQSCDAYSFWYNSPFYISACIFWNDVLAFYVLLLIGWWVCQFQPSSLALGLSVIKRRVDLSFAYFTAHSYLIRTERGVLLFISFSSRILGLLVSLIFDWGVHFLKIWISAWFLLHHNGYWFNVDNIFVVNLTL